MVIDKWSSTPTVTLIINPYPDPNINLNISRHLEISRYVYTSIYIARR